MNNLILIVKNTRELYDKQVKIANMVIDGKLAADYDAIKNNSDFQYIIFRAYRLATKNLCNITREDIKETRKYLIDYILGEFVPSIQEPRNKSKKDEFLKKLHDLLAEYNAEIGFKCNEKDFDINTLSDDCIEIRMPQGGSYKTIFSTNEGSWWIDELGLRKFAK